MIDQRKELVIDLGAIGGKPAPERFAERPGALSRRYDRLLGLRLASSACD
jgi:hypothetical protein